VKIEAASNDITVYPCDDKPGTGTLCFMTPPLLDSARCKGILFLLHTVLWDRNHNARRRLQFVVLVNIMVLHLSFVYEALMLHYYLSHYYSMWQIIKSLALLVSFCLPVCLYSYGHSFCPVVHRIWRPKTQNYESSGDITDDVTLNCVYVWSLISKKRTRQMVGSYWLHVGKDTNTTKPMVTWPMMSLIANCESLRLRFVRTNNGCKILANITVIVVQWDRYLVPCLSCIFMFCIFREFFWGESWSC